MERNMELVLGILRGVNTSKGDWGAGFTYVVAPEPRAHHKATQCSAAACGCVPRR